MGGAGGMGGDGGVGGTGDGGRGGEGGSPTSEPEVTITIQALEIVRYAIGEVGEDPDYDNPEYPSFSPASMHFWTRDAGILRFESAIPHTDPVAMSLGPDGEVYVEADFFDPNYPSPDQPMPEQDLPASCTLDLSDALANREPGEEIAETVECGQSRWTGPAVPYLELLNVTYSIKFPLGR